MLLLLYDLDPPATLYTIELGFTCVYIIVSKHILCVPVRIATISVLSEIDFQELANQKSVL